MGDDGVADVYDGSGPSHSTGGGGAFGPFHQPRIRHVTGIRIHQLTLPNALPLASRFLPEHQASHDAPDGYHLGEPSLARLSSPDTKTTHSLHRVSSASFPSSRRERRISATGTLVRERSNSSSFAPLPSPTIQARIRGGRPRAPTLAGEAMEGHPSPAAGVHLHGSMDEQRALEEVKKRRLAKCFVVLKIRASKAPVEEDDGDGVIPAPKRATSDDPPKRKTLSRPAGEIARRSSFRASSFQSLSSPPTTPKLRPSLSSSSRSSFTGTTAGGTQGTRTTSLTPASPRSKQTANGGPDGKTSPARSSSRLGAHSPRASRPEDDPHLRRHGASSPKVSLRGSILGPSKTRPPLAAVTGPHRDASTSPHPSSPQAKAPTSLVVPFYISPIHHPSTHPRWLSLSHETDFAPWLTVEESASHSFDLEIWYDDPEAGWKMLSGVGGGVDLGMLRRVEKDDNLPENTVEFTLGTDPRSLYFLPKLGLEIEKCVTENESLGRKSRGKATESVRGVVERSLRETRMKEGSGVGALHQLVNMQAVIADTQRGIEQVQRKIDALLSVDTDSRALRRDVAQRENGVTWIRERITEVEKTMREVEAQITLQRRAIEQRKRRLREAEEADDLLRGKVQELQTDIESYELERAALLPLIHHFRAHHVQTLDVLFPITPIYPVSLLYAILDVPLPIPSGSKDPAPPLTLPPSALPEGVKVDERTTAAALGYVAMVVQILGSLGGTTGGLPYPVTCAGSRSLVKDVVSVMQGTRSFPLYSKGVERYRYEYAVFLLNKDIEMLLQEANIRLVDIRHTLPNLKALLLTLSSPVPPPPPIRRQSGSTTFVDSRASSRQTSRAWSVQRGLVSPGSSVATAAASPANPIKGDMNQVAPNSASPLTRIHGEEPKRRSSLLSRASLSMEERGDGGGDPEKVDSNSEEEAERVNA